MCVRVYVRVTFINILWVSVVCGGPAPDDRFVQVNFWSS